MFKRRKQDDTPEVAPSSTPSRPGAPQAPASAVPVGPRPDVPPQTTTPRPAASDNGLGVPPFRPATPPQPKDATSMNRPTVPPSLPPSGSTSSPAGGGLAAPRPPTPPGVRPGGPAPRETGPERRTLVVGRGISVQGSVQDAERLVVEGTVEATNIRAAELSVAPGGVFRGEVEVDEAELAGTIDGTLVAHGTLVVRASGKLLGAARCRRLQVEDGGQISGRIEMMTDGASRVDTVSRVGEAPKPLNDKPAPVPPAPVAAN